ncbi:MAG: hypothetical protein WED11_11350, partial [Natronospirillum sp.]
THGPKDMLWLIELECRYLVVCGHFLCPIQYRAQQSIAATDTVDARPSPLRLDGVYLGLPYFKNQGFLGLRSTSSVELADLSVHELIAPEVEVGSFRAAHCAFRRFHCPDATVSGDFFLGSCALSDAVFDNGFFFKTLTIKKASHLSGKLSFNRCTVQGALVLEGQHGRATDQPPLKLDFFAMNCTLLHVFPQDLMTNGKQAWIRPRFNTIEHQGTAFKERDDESRNHLVREYSILRQAFARAGLTQNEDICYTRMRYWAEPRRLNRFFFGDLFGWGVWLKNIVLTSLLVLLVCTVIYWLGFSLSAQRSLTLSAQSFFNVFLGDWGVSLSNPTGILAVLVLLQSIVGLILVSVFIGAYIRKMLR